MRARSARRPCSVAFRMALLAAIGLATHEASADPQRPIAASTDDDRARAREAYDRGAAAHLRGDEATAARELALADSIVPNPVTLQAALEAALVADDAVLGVTLCDRADRADRAPHEAALLAVARRARARFGPRVGHVRVACEGPSPCTLALDGTPIEAGRPVVVLAGRHAVTIQRGEQGSVERRELDVEPAGAATLVITDGAQRAPATEPPRAPDVPPSASASRSRPWFFGALAATAVAGGVTIGFGVDTAAKHASFVSAGCAGPVHGDCSALASDGSAAQLRTNALGVVTSVLGVATTVTGAVTLPNANGAPRAGFTIGPGVAMLRLDLP